MFSFLKPRKLTPKELGRLGENIALKFLQKQGFRLEARNWKTKYGELDLVMHHNGQLIFVEVKTRYNVPLAREMIFENITAKKLNKLKRLSIHYLVKKFGRFKCPDYRIDVVAVLVDTEVKNRAEVFHQKGW